MLKAIHIRNSHNPNKAKIYKRICLPKHNVKLNEKDLAENIMYKQSRVY